MSDKDGDYMPFSNQSEEGSHIAACNLNLWEST